LKPVPSSTQAREQHSSLPLQASPAASHSSRTEHLPASQMPLQQSDPSLQISPSLRHLPPVRQRLSSPQRPEQQSLSD